MEITIIHGSPRNQMSSSRVYINYIIRQFREHTFTVFPVGCTINRLESSGSGDREYFGSILEQVQRSEAVLWVTPVYQGLIPGQLKRFIELLFQSGSAGVFAGKYTSLLLSYSGCGAQSAAGYLRALCDDLKMHFVETFGVRCFPALPGEEELTEYRRNLPLFAEHLFNAAAARTVTSPAYPLPFRKKITYPSLSAEPVAKTNQPRAVLLTDKKKPAGNLQVMVDIFCTVLPLQVELISLEDTVQSGCRGCFECIGERGCSAGDDFNRVTAALQEAPGLICAATVEDRFIQARFKYFLDRAAMSCPGLLAEKQAAFIISGNLMENHGIKEVLHYNTEYLGASLTGFITDEQDKNCLTGQLAGLADCFCRNIRTGYTNRICCGPSRTALPGGLISTYQGNGLLSSLGRNKNKHILSVLTRELAKLHKILGLE